MHTLTGDQHSGVAVMSRESTSGRSTATGLVELPGCLRRATLNGQRDVVLHRFRGVANSGVALMVRMTEAIEVSTANGRAELADHRNLSAEQLLEVASALERAAKPGLRLRR